MNTNGKTALVTGASSGIGTATAERLSVAGFKAYGAGGPSFEMLPPDVTSDESLATAVKSVSFDHSLTRQTVA